MIKRRQNRVRKLRRLRLERLDARLVLASVSGIVFEDLDASAGRDANEPGLADRIIFADLNRNGVFDAAEPYQRSAADGSYTLDDLPAGEYFVRLFNGSSAQQQTGPFSLDADPNPIGATASSLLTPLAGGGLVYIDDAGAAVRLDADGNSSSVLLERTVVSIGEISGGRVIVVFEPEANEASAAIVNFDTGQLEPADFAAAGSPVVQDVHLTSTGQGLMIVEENDTYSLWSIDASGPTITTAATGFDVASTTQLLSGGFGQPQIGVVTPAGDNLAFQIWNATSESFERDGNLSDVVAVEAFDARNEWLVAVGSDGSRSLRDVSSSFSTLHSLSQTRGPLTLDPVRKQVYTFSADADELISFDVISGTAHAYPAAFSGGASTAREMVFLTAEQRVVLATATALHRLNIDLTAGHPVNLLSQSEAAGLDFGVKLLGQNTAPSGDPNIVLDGLEDRPLEVGPGGLLGTASDVDGDAFVALLISGASHGSIVVGHDGSAVYTPDTNYVGSDEIAIVLHDGVAASSPITIPITVNGNDAPPSDFTVDFNAIGEHAPPGTVVGTISVQDPDPEDAYAISVADSRFEVVGNELRRAAEGILNFELLDRLPLVFTGVHVQRPTVEISKTINVNVADENDPITGTNLPPILTVPENVLPGQTIFEIVVFDEDQNDKHIIDVLDGRFEVVDGDLQLKEGVKLDFEDELPDVVVTFIARDADVPDDSITEQVTVTIGDENDPPTGLNVNSASVPENVPGATIAPVSFNDQDKNDTHTFDIDDNRFEIVDGVLKLKDGVAVSRADATIIHLNITVTDSGDPPLSNTTLTQIIVTENASPYHNEENPGDVNGDGSVTPEDAIILINILNQDGPGPISGDLPLGDFYDVNNDGHITPLDVLIIINKMNRAALGEVGTGGTPSAGNGEFANFAPPLQRSRGAADEAIENVVEDLDAPAAAAEQLSASQAAERAPSLAAFDWNFARPSDDDDDSDGPADPLLDPLHNLS